MTAPAATALTPGLESIELPGGSEQRYLDRFGVGAIYVICGPSGYPCVIGSGVDLGAALKAIRRAWPEKIDGPILAWAAWCFDQRTAQQIANLVVASDLRLARKDGPRFAISIDEATRAITAAAGRLKFRLTTHEAVMARAKAAGVSLGSKLDQVQAAGDLKDFNREYSRRRTAWAAAGKGKFISYNEARSRLVAILATAGSGKPVKDVLQAVFED